MPQPDRVTVTITVTAADFAARLAFYDAVLPSLGLRRVTELVDEEDDDPSVEAVGWGSDGDHPAIWLIIGPAPGTTGLHLRIRTESRLQVETFYAMSVSSDAISVAAPRRWTPYRRGEFSATVRDPAGNAIEAVAPE